MYLGTNEHVTLETQKLICFELKSVQLSIVSVYFKNLVPGCFGSRNVRPVFMVAVGNLKAYFRTTHYFIFSSLNRTSKSPLRIGET